MWEVLRASLMMKRRSERPERGAAHTAKPRAEKYNNQAMLEIKWWSWFSIFYIGIFFVILTEYPLSVQLFLNVLMTLRKVFMQKQVKKKKRWCEQNDFYLHSPCLLLLAKHEHDINTNTLTERLNDDEEFPKRTRPNVRWGELTEHARELLSFLFFVFQINHKKEKSSKKKRKLAIYMTYSHQPLY